jgi:hypothetical protein
MGPDRRPRRRPERSSARPTWWVLLAVSMAVMAVIFARSAGTSHRSNSASTSRPPNPRTFEGRSARTTAQTPLLKQVSPVSSQPSSATTPGTPQQTGGALPSPSSPTSTSATTPVGQTVESYPGYLSYPENVVSSYPIPGMAGDVTASASWPSDVTLDLSISCPSGQRSVAGVSTASVSMVVTSPSCTVKLSEATAVTEPVAYKLTITISPDT